MKQSIKASETIGGNIRLFRKEARLTQEVMTARLQLLGCNLMRGTYSKIEAGIRHISYEELKAIIAVLGIDYNILFGYEKQD